VKKEETEYKIETTSADILSLKSILGDTSDLDEAKMIKEEETKIKNQRAEQLRQQELAEKQRQEEIKIEQERLIAEKKAA